MEYTYQLIKLNGEPVDTVLRVEDQLNIPKDLRNPYYIEYLEWLEDGNTPLDPEGEEE